MLRLLRPFRPSPIWESIAEVWVLGRFVRTSPSAQRKTPNHLRILVPLSADFSSAKFRELPLHNAPPLTQPFGRLISEGSNHPSLQAQTSFLCSTNQVTLAAIKAFYIVGEANSNKRPPGSSCFLPKSPSDKRHLLLASCLHVRQNLRKLNWINSALSSQSLPLSSFSRMSD